MLIPFIAILSGLTWAEDIPPICYKDRIPDMMGAWICDDAWVLTTLRTEQNEEILLYVHNRIPVILADDLSKCNVFRTFVHRIPNYHSVDKIRVSGCYGNPVMRISTESSNHSAPKSQVSDNWPSNWELWDVKTHRIITASTVEYGGFGRQATLWKIEFLFRNHEKGHRECTPKFMFHARAGMLALLTSVGYPKTPIFRKHTIGRSKRDVTEAPLSNRCRKVTKIPPRMAKYFELNTTFYNKYTSAYGIPVMASKIVDKSVFALYSAFCLAFRALQRACYALRVLLAERKDMRDHLFTNKGRITVMAINQTVPMVPELMSYVHWSGRALGGTLENPITVIGEEHLLCENDSYSASQDVLIHEIAHAIHAVASRTALPTLDFWISESYREAQRSGLWTNTYANTDHLEYFAEGVQAYFNQQREGLRGGDGIQNEINTNKELKTYDPTLHKIIKGIFPCRNRIVPRCEDLSQKKGFNQKVRMDCKHESVAPPITDPCKDANWSCSYWANVGECNRNPTFMLEYCKRSCSVCTPGSATITTSSAEEDHINREPERIMTSTIRSSQSPALCKDEHEDCPSWISYCATLPHIGVQCKLSCGLCYSTTQIPVYSTVQSYITKTKKPDCADKDVGCPYWESYCSSLPHIRDVCPKTCKICEPTTSITVESKSLVPTAAENATRCKDKGRNCYLKKAHCEKISVQERCPVTCGSCASSQHNHVTTATSTPLTSTTAKIRKPHCKDRRENCSSWMNKCYKPYAKKNCRFTCNLCDTRNKPNHLLNQDGSHDATVGNCTDSSEHCSFWVSRCSNNRYVRKNCRQTCGFCHQGWKLSQEIESGGDNRDKKGVCRDSDENCDSWTSHCTSHRYVKTHCKLTCNLCGV